MIRRSTRLLAMALLAISSSALLAADTGTITGKVVDSKGAAVSGAHVKVGIPPPRPDMDKSKPKPQAEDGKDGKEGRGGKDRPRPKLVAEGMSKADGTFSIDGVPAGKFMVGAFLEGVGFGKLAEMVTLTAGQKLDVGVITLEQGKGPHGDRKPGKKPENN